MSLYRTQGFNSLNLIWSHKKLIIFLFLSTFLFNFHHTENFYTSPKSLISLETPVLTAQGISLLFDINQLKPHTEIETISVTDDKSEPIDVHLNKISENLVDYSKDSSRSIPIPANFKDRVSFWLQIYAKYGSEEAVFHDSQNLSLIYKVVDLKPLTRSSLHPFVIEHKVKKLIEKERKILIADLHSIQRKFKKKNFTAREQQLYETLSKPQKKSQIIAALNNLRMQLGQRDFVEKALINSDLYLAQMETIFEEKGLPKELTRIPFVESSFNLNARSRVGASGIWQIMPATGRKLMPNEHVDYRNDPIKATDFAATFLKFNFRVLDSWPLAITAYNHGPTSIKRLTKKYKTDDLSEIIKKAYGSHAFGFASSNFYACFLAILEVEKNRSLLFPETPRQLPLTASRIQIKKSIKYPQLLSWFENDRSKTDLYNPHLSNSIKKGQAKIPAGTYLYVPENVKALAASEDWPRWVRKF